MKHEPLVGIIVLHWTGVDDTRQCLNSLRAIGYSNRRLYLVDNASFDQGGVRLKDEFKSDVHFIRNQTNLGFAGGNNVGLRQALTDGCEFVLIINNDTTVKPDFLDRLVETALADESIGLIGPKILSFEPKDKIWFSGGRIQWSSGVRIGHRGVGEADCGQYDLTEPTDWLTGCCVLARRSAIEKAGLMPAEYFLYFEDVDWSVAIQRAGFKLVFEPRSVIWHKEASESASFNPQKLYYQARNYPQFVKRYANRWQRIIFVVFFIVYYGQLMIRNLLAGRSKSIPMIWWGLQDYFRGRFGPMEVK